MLPYASLVVGNEDEFRALAERVGIVQCGDESIGSVARQVANHLNSTSPGNELANFQG